MSDFLNPLGGRFVGPSSPVAPSAVAGTVPDPPRAFQQLDPGTIIKGVVLGRESDGLTAIATDKGTIRVASNALLPAGTHVTLEVRPTGDRLQVLILSNDALQRGMPTNTPAASSAAGAQAAQVAAGQPSAPAAGTHPQLPALPATSAAGPDARGPDPRPADARNAATTATQATTVRADPPSIEFVGSSLRAVVVQSPPPQQPQPAQPTPSPTSTTQTPVQAQPTPAPIPTPAISTPPVQSQPIPTAPTTAPPPILPTPPAQGQPTSAPIPVPPALSLPVPLPPPSQPAPIAAVPDLPTSPIPTTPAPVAQTPGQPAPVPPPVAAIPPAPVELPPLPTGTLPTTPPSTTTPPPPTPPVTPLPQGGQPVLPVIPLPNVQMPAAIPNVANMQAALIAATAEKKGKSGQPVTTLPAGTTLPRNAGPIPPALPTTPTQTSQATAAPGAQPTGNLQQVPAGSALSADTRLRILALFASAAATAENSQHAATDEAQSVTGPITAKHPAQPLPLGAELKLRVLAVQMQAHQQIEIDPIAVDPHEAHGQVIFGRVVAITPAGHAVIHTPLGDIMLQNRSSLPLGAKLALAIDTLETAPPSAMAAAPLIQTPQQALLSLAQSWPTLADLIAVLQGANSTNGKPGAIDPEIAHQALALLPHAGNKLAAGMMNAMAALRAGDLGKLMGSMFAAKGAGAEREEQVRRLRNEFAQLSALAQERPEVDWRAMFLPVIDDQGRVTQVNLFYRRPKKGETEDRAGGTGTRFVVEADFSRLGPFQLDGLMRQQRFDLMIRSRARLTDRMRRDIETIYEEARGLTGFAGSIAFQTVDEFPVIPLDELKRGTPTVMV